VVDVCGGGSLTSVLYGGCDGVRWFSSLRSLSFRYVRYLMETLLLCFKRQLIKVLGVFDISMMFLMNVV
jgi:hypothetical protein